MTGQAPRYSIVGDRAPIFWSGCAMISLGVLLHLPMLGMAHAMGNNLAGMAMDPWMHAGMALIGIGVPAACYGALPGKRVSHGSDAGTHYEAPDDTPLGRWHAAVLVVMVLGLIVDTMKPATLGFVLPGLAREYGISRSTAALLPLVALTGTTIGSFIWGVLADMYGRRVSILLSTILFVSTSICGAMPAFEWNLLMCFLMGCSAGGMLPVVYTLLAEVMPPRHRGWVLVLVGGTGLVGGYLAASGAAMAFEPDYGWRSLWLQGFPTGLLLLGLARFIPESPRFLANEGRGAELADMRRKYGIGSPRHRSGAVSAEDTRLGPWPHHRRADDRRAVLELREFRLAAVASFGPAGTGLQPGAGQRHHRQFGADRASDDHGRGLDIQPTEQQVDAGRHDPAHARRLARRAVS